MQFDSSVERSLTNVVKCVDNDDEEDNYDDDGNN